ncbi:MAG TPA: hypothetical protein VNI52_09855 [Sphingobacteriaceae bacterium]|nr:hypothetical protein [Sphingobacteriaceae bacterium]
MKFSKPKICTFSLPKGQTLLLENHFDEVYEGSLGLVQRANYQINDNCTFLPNSNIPKNIQEYDIFIFDFNNVEISEYNSLLNRRTDTKSTTEIYFKTSNPQKVFDPRMFVVNRIFEAIYKKGKSVNIIFSAEQETINYELLDVLTRNVSSIAFNTYSFLSENIGILNKFGTELTFPPSPCQYLFEQLAKDLNYKAVFQVENYFLESHDLNLIPLAINNDEELVAFILESKTHNYVFLPDIKGKV